MKINNIIENPPLVTVITIVKNGADKIQRAINSVNLQDYSNIEYIIKDGLSTDATKHVVENCMNKNTRFISLHDSGISDAWNQAIECSSGEIIALLNCDDYWSSDFISSAVNEIMISKSDLVFGDTILVDSEYGNRFIKAGWSNLFLWKGIGFLHPSVVATRSCYLNIFPFRTDLKFAMDADWIIRLYNSGAKFSKHNGISFMSAGGLSNRLWLYARLEYIHVLRVAKANFFTYYLAWFWFAILWIKKNIKY